MVVRYYRIYQVIDEYCKKSPLVFQSNLHNVFEMVEKQKKNTSSFEIFFRFVSRRQCAIVARSISIDK